MVLYLCVIISTISLTILGILNKCCISSHMSIYEQIPVSKVSFVFFILFLLIGVLYVLLFLIFSCPVFNDESIMSLINSLDCVEASLFPVLCFESPSHS